MGCGVLTGPTQPVLSYYSVFVDCQQMEQGSVWSIMIVVFTVLVDFWSLGKCHDGTAGLM